VPFVPDDFVIPREMNGGWCRLRPLAVSDNERDFAAWHSSVDHIGATPGFAGRDWPVLDYTLERNADDLAEHAADFAARRGFTYTVLDEANGDVIGCVYIYPSKAVDADASVRSWVTAAHAARDIDLHRLVRAWLDDAWPFESVVYAPRVDASEST
jgi:hypothetical protein